MNRTEKAYLIAVCVMLPLLAATAFATSLISMADAGAIGLRARQQVPEAMAGFDLPPEQLAERGDVNTSINNLAVNAAMEQLESAWVQSVFFAIVCSAAAAWCTARIYDAKRQDEAEATSPSPPPAPPPRAPAP